jgi:hypothetical protein
LIDSTIYSGLASSILSVKLWPISSASP